MRMIPNQPFLLKIGCCRVPPSILRQALYQGERFTQARFFHQWKVRGRSIVLDTAYSDGRME